MSVIEQTSQLALGRFELRATAGSGGGGDVFEAIDRRDGTAVALKIARDVAGSEALALEAEHAALALSPRLPELVEVGWISIVDGAGIVRASGADARAFIALRWAEGAPLDARRPRSEEERVALALAVARDVAEAMGDLHGLGIAHGDLKPQNIIVNARGEARVIDLGLASSAAARSISGGTPRYLARGDADLGDARARDLIALGALLAEIVDAGVARSDHPIRAARIAMLPASIAAICSALLAPAPGARPSAAWVADAAEAAARASGAGPRARRRDDSERRSERDGRRVRSTYLRLRRDELESANAAHVDAPRWLSEAIALAARARSIASSPERPPSPARVLAPLAAEDISRWLTALVGSSATSWPVASLTTVTESRLAEGLTALARARAPAGWSYRDVEQAVVEESRALPTPIAIAHIDAAEAARLALAIARTPADATGLEVIEQHSGSDAPTCLVIAAAEALRLRGELGRARSLVLSLHRAGALGVDAIASDVLRRAGDLDLASTHARAAIEASADPDGRARAVLARIAFDAGRLDDADLIAGNGATPALCEIRALSAGARGDASLALAEVRRGEALARTSEERARFSAVRGWVAHGHLGGSSDPAAARDAYAAAVDHATRAGAVIEEATYRTSEAAAAADLGDLGAAIATSKRAALLWEHLGRPELAARALLACAAAYATAGATHDAKNAAELAIRRARDGSDARAEAYAELAIADVEPEGSEEGARAAERASRAVEGGSAEDRLRAAARALRHRVLSPEPSRVGALDDLAAEDGTLSAGARLDWWGARARGLLEHGGDERRVLAALTGLAEARAAIGTRGPALLAAYDLAARSGQGEVAQRLLASLADAGRELMRRAPPELADSVRALPWVARGLAAPEGGMRPEQARDLEAVIHLLSERERLGPLLNRVVDALVLWTGVERGLLLLRAPDGRLVPRAARNLARVDLGPEQMALSLTLAKRALEAREPVVAVDAAGELPSVHQSVHALKLRSVLAVPLIARGEALGVAYLDDRVRRGAFGPRELHWARTIATLAALAICDARDQVLLRRAARRAERAGAKLAETLAEREALLDVAERELARARAAPRGTRFRYDEIVGESEPIQAMLRTVDRLTSADVPVLIHGESGSGKELVARAIHQNGPRSGRPFVGENCGAIPEGLLESALFGHVRGAFTGADRPRAGLFEIADRGTLFLDEIGEMGPSMQTKLLRILEDGLVKPVGSERARKVDVRVIAATHRDLDAMVKAKAFREDLLYRLNIIVLKIPPLRERPSDIPLLVQSLLQKHAPDRKVRVTKAAMERLVAYPFPGNVRQLENVIRRAIVLSDGVIDREHLSPEIAEGNATSAGETGLNVRRRVDGLEGDLVRDALSRTKGNQTQAAKLLGLSRFGLQKMIKRLAIS